MTREELKAVWQTMDNARQRYEALAYANRPQQEDARFDLDMNLRLALTGMLDAEDVYRRAFREFRREQAA